MSVFESVNKHCLEKIVALSETHVVTASEDIYDRNGVKLWAKGGQISPALRERLSAHKLRTPLELSLEVQNSLSTGDVFEDCQRMIAADPALISIAGSRAAIATLSHLRMVQLPSSLRLLLSAAHDKDDKAYRHLLYTIAVCAGFATYSKMAIPDVEVLLAAALLHDVGEIYINPEYLHANRPLAAKEWSAVAAHPKVGYLVSQEIGKLKEPVGLGIYQHHERLDGSGYPNMLGKERISRVGAIVAAADATAAILLRGGDGAAYQAALAIRVIPEEFDADMRGFVNTSLRDLAIESGFDPQGLAQTKWIVEKLDRSDAAIAALLPTSTGKVRDSLLMAKNVCDNVRKAIRAIGIDFLLQTVSADDDGGLFGGEVSHVVRETGWRLRNLARNIQLRAEMQSSQDQETLASLISLLESQPKRTAPTEAPVSA